MFSGWIKPFKVDRLLESEERMNALVRQRDRRVDPNDWGSLIHFNSTYADFVDRRYRLRGMVSTATGLLISPLLFFFGLVFIGYFIWVDSYLSGEIGAVFAITSTLVFSLMCFGGPLLFWRIHLRHDLFTYTHYPIRFNRNARKVHVFRYNGPGGVLTVPFDDVFWHVGRGLQQTYLCDVRGHVMDRNMVRDTFAVGHYFSDDKIDRIRGLWEFIRRYMDEGPEAVADDPRDRHVEMSVDETWTNCYIHVVASMGMGMYRLRFVLFPVVYPLRWLLTLTRWLTFKTCKQPEWPSEIEAECRIEPGDPNRWPEPGYTGEFDNDPAIWARKQERLSRCP